MYISQFSHAGSHIIILANHPPATISTYVFMTGYYMKTLHVLFTQVRTIAHSCCVLNIAGSLIYTYKLLQHHS